MILRRKEAWLTLNNGNNGRGDSGQPRKSFFRRIKDKISTALDRYEDKRARKDIIFTETITPQPEVKAPAIVSGSIDYQFLLTVIALIAFGAAMSFSASYAYAEYRYDDSTYFIKRYVLFALISVMITAFFVFIATPRFWRMFGVGAYAVSVVLLLLVLVIGSTGGGAQRWISFGFFTIQPSEIAKMAVVMMLALYMSHYEKEIKSVHVFGGSFKKGVLMPGIIIGLICGLVMLERHISGVIIIGLIGLAVMYLGGTQSKWIYLIIGILGFTALTLILVSSYAQERVASWLAITFSPDSVDATGDAWQTLHGLDAIGSGGLFGRGLGNSLLKSGYVSQPQNDFIFTIICEELGFVGAALVLGLFGILVWRGFHIAARCPDKYLSLVAYGLSFKVALQVILNVAVVTNSIPNTGVSLPFFSSGGTSLAVQIFEMGVILSISRYSAEKKG